MPVRALLTQELIVLNWWTTGICWSLCTLGQRWAKIFGGGCCWMDWKKVGRSSMLKVPLVKLVKWWVSQVVPTNDKKRKEELWSKELLISQSRQSMNFTQKTLRFMYYRLPGKLTLVRIITQITIFITVTVGISQYTIKISGECTSTKWYMFTPVNAKKKGWWSSV